MLPIELFSAPAGSRLDHCALDVDHLAAHLAITTPNAACPACGADSGRVHSRYTRRLADLPCFGRPVRLHVTARRFFCPLSHCPRRIFAERLPGLAEPFARTTPRLRRAHESIGYALGGEAGARLTLSLAMAISPDTLLRRVKQIAQDSAPPPRFVGIDDWAWRKGRTYGTIIVDLERSAVIDLLPDRDPETVKLWLDAHPEVELISRDRWPDYVRAATEAAPGARQVADRWHLLKNLREAVERLFERESEAIEQALEPGGPTPQSEVAPEGTTAIETPPATDSPSPPVTVNPIPASPRQEAREARRRRRVERFERVHELKRQGRTIRSIARELGLTREVVKGYLRRTSCPDWRPGRPTRSGLNKYREEIDARIAVGRTNAAELHRELAARGCRLSYAAVRRYVTKRLAAAGKSRARVNAAPAPAPPLPSAKQLSFGWMRRPEDRNDEQQARLDAIRGRSDELSAALDLADEFAGLIRGTSEGTLSGWLSRAEASPCPELLRFAEGIRRDESAVQAAVSERWSNGPVEGHINRLKLIKRQMYGRAGLVLLRARVVSAA